jgi:hypothetical protein
MALRNNQFSDTPQTSTFFFSPFFWRIGGDVWLKTAIRRSRKNTFPTSPPKKKSFLFANNFTLELRRIKKKVKVKNFPANDPNY